VTPSSRPLVPRFVVATVLVSGIFTGVLLVAGSRAGSVEVEEAAAAAVSKNPFAEIERPRAGDERFTGKVVELRAAGPYTYASIDVGQPGTESRLRWVVMLRAGAIARGDRVVVKSFGTQREFRSRRLGMTFDELVFGVVRPDESIEKRPERAEARR
jgi:hypothetical protein